MSAPAIDGRDIRAVTPADVGRADLWTASFPCTDLSLAGGRAGIREGQSSAVWALLDLLEAMTERDRPSRLMFENVMGLLSSGGGADFRALTARVNELGYGVDPLFVDAAWFTAQSRPRLYLLCARIDAVERADVEAVEASRVRPARLVAAMRANADLVWHARETPEPPRAGVRVESVLEDLEEDDPRWWSAARAAYFVGQIHPSHAAYARRMIDGRGESRVCAYRRVRPIEGVKKSVIELRADGLAGCLRLPKGGSAKQMLLCAGDGRARVRYLTARECARLQGAPEPAPGFTENELLAGYGDAVCVPAARWALDRFAVDRAGVRRSAVG
ncbi:MAG: DNA cytosine methyltransferase, partial [Phycisphaerales bacterium]